MELPVYRWKQEAMIWTKPPIIEQPKDTEDRESPALSDKSHLWSPSTSNTLLLLFTFVCFASQSRNFPNNVPLMQYRSAGDTGPVNTGQLGRA